MSLYDLIADEYSAIFPLDKTKVSFITKICPSKDSPIIDVGCATGDLAIELNKLGYKITGIDLNERMVTIAKQKVTTVGSGINFRVLNMLDVAQLTRSFCVLCFGNTLPHLRSNEDVYSFFLAVRAILDNDGLFVFELLNYDKILKEKKAQFNRIETESVVFIRDYTFLSDGRISFQIKVEDKNKEESYTDLTLLLPLKQSFLIDIAKRTGFKEIVPFSDYNFTPSNLSEFSTVYVCKK